MGLDEGTVPERLAEQAGYCRALGSPLYSALLEQAADDAGRGGVVAELLGPVAGPYGSMLGLRLMSAVHRIVLQGAAPALAAITPPSVEMGTGGRRGAPLPICFTRAPTTFAACPHTRFKRTRSAGPRHSSAASSRSRADSRSP
jgi:hypothetical protein